MLNGAVLGRNVVLRTEDLLDAFEVRGRTSVFLVSLALIDEARAARPSTSLVKRCEHSELSVLYQGSSWFHGTEVVE